MADFVFKHPVIADFVHLTKPDDQGNYSMVLLIDKNTPEGQETINDVQKGINEAVEYAFTQGQPLAGFDPKTTIPTLINPLKDGDKDLYTKGAHAGHLRKEIHPEFEGKMFLLAKTQKSLLEKPNGIFDTQRQPVATKDLYSGMLVRPIIWFASYNKGGNRGIRAILNYVLRTGDGERLTPVAPEFDPFAAFGLPEPDGEGGATNAFAAMGI